jgi:uncharacterized protein
MSSAGLLFVGLVIAVGVAGTVVPLLPGPLLVLAAIGVWAFEVDGVVGWTVLTVAVALVGVAAVAKYLVPGRALHGEGVPSSTLLVGGLVGVVGFFVVPLLGLVVGFVVGVYVAELRRLGTSAAAAVSTRRALRAVGLSLLIELAGSLLAASTWLAAVLVSA